MRQLDSEAHLEAAESGGLLDYVAGSDEGARASVCVWESKDAARRAAALPAHRRAAAEATSFYSSFEIRCYEV